MTWARTWGPVLLAAVVVSLGMPGTRTAFAETEEDIPLLPGSDPNKSLPETEDLEKQQPKDEDKEEANETAEKWIQLAKRFGAAQIEGFDIRQAKKFAVIPDAALRLTRGMFDNMVAIHKASAEGGTETLGPVADGCLVVAVLLDRRKEQTEEIKAAAAFGRLAYVWGRSLLGSPIGHVKIAEAATFVQGLTAAPVTQPTWIAFVRAALKGSVSSASVATWVEAEVTRLVKDAPDGVEMIRLRTVRDLVTAQRLAATGDKAAAGPTLTKVLTALAPEVAIKSEDVELVGLYNHTVTAARRLKVSVKAPYRTSKAKTSTNLVTFEYPRGTGWVSAGSDSDTTDGMWTRNLGEREKTTIQVRKYDHRVVYSMGDGARIAGDTLTGWLKYDMQAAQAELTKVKKAADSAPPLSKSISAKGFEVRGIGNVTQDVWHRGWYFKADGKLFTVAVTVKREGQALEPDPELESILESMEEPKPKK